MSRKQTNKKKQFDAILFQYQIYQNTGPFNEKKMSVQLKFPKDEAAATGRSRLQSVFSGHPVRTYKNGALHSIDHRLVLCVIGKTPAIDNTL